MQWQPAHKPGLKYRVPASTRSACCDSSVAFWEWPNCIGQTTRDGRADTIAFTHTHFQINQIYKLKMEVYRPDVTSPLWTQRWSKILSRPSIRLAVVAMRGKNIGAAILKVRTYRMVCCFRHFLFLKLNFHCHLCLKNMQSKNIFPTHLKISLLSVDWDPLIS